MRDHIEKDPSHRIQDDLGIDPGAH